MNASNYIKRLYPFLPVLFPLLLSAQIKTLDPVFNPDIFNIHHIGPEEGMSSAFISGSFMDRYGYLWIGTQYGLDVYNGYEFRNIRMKDSDSVNTQLLHINYFMDDKDGGLWLCSLQGLYYYDRLSQDIIPHLPLPEYPDSIVNTVLGISQDSRGVYWVFTWGGLLHYDRTKDVFIPTEIPYTFNWHPSVQRKNFTLLELDDGSVYIPDGPNGLYKYNPDTEKFTHYVHDPENPGSISSNQVLDATVDENGNIWIATLDAGLNIMTDSEGNAFEHIRYESGNPEGLFGDNLATIDVDRSGNIWIAGSNGFSKFNPKKEKFESYLINNKYFDYSRQGFDNDIIQILEDSDGDIWFRPYGSQGLLFFDPDSEELSQFTIAQNKISGKDYQFRIQNLFNDRTGLIWAIGESSIIIIDKSWKKPFHFLKYDKNVTGTISHSSVQSIYQDPDNTLWLGMMGPVLNRCSDFDQNLPQYFTHFPIFEKLHNPMLITSIIEKDSESLWIGTYNGLYIFDKNTEKFSPFRHKPLIDSIFNIMIVDAIFMDTEGLFWIGTRHHGLFVYDITSDKLANYKGNGHDPDNQPGDWVFTYFEDRKGNIWIGHFYGGISLLKKEERSKIFTQENLKFETYDRLIGESSNIETDQVMQIHQDMSDRMWIATTDGLYLHNPVDDNFFSFHESDGLPVNCLYGLLEDDKGNLWASTSKGISKIILNDGIDRDIIQSIHNYEISEGFEKTLFAEKSCFKSEDGWMYFGSFEGLIVFHPDSIKDNTVVPPVYITDIHINDLPLADQKEVYLQKSLFEAENSIQLPSNYNFLSFEYVALNYLNAEKGKYRYMMDGLDENWVDAGTRRFAEYRDLKPGSYTFRVIASNEDGFWNEEGASIFITIDPPWYLTTLAYIFYLGLLIATIFGYSRWRTWKFRKERDLLEVQVQERTTVIKDQNKDILEANTQLEEQKEELEQQTEELTQQKEELQNTLNRLEETQDQLIQSEKMAALGGLVAGVAHEINTPVGISVTAASNLVEETKVMAEKYKENKISKADFKEYLTTANQSAKLILANMERTAEMVQSFKQISADQSTGEKRRVVLRTYVEDIIRSLYPKLKGRKIAIILDIDPNLEIDSYPGAISQIFTNLILNSLVHGYEEKDNEKDKGEISIQSEIIEGKLNIHYSDSGKGIAAENMKRIFEPFFTTNKNAGTGLGLHIVYNLVTQKLNGSISCDSKPGEGVVFNITIPL